MGLLQQQMAMQGIVNSQAQFQQGFGMPQPPQPMQAPVLPIQQQQRQMQAGNPMEMHQPIPGGPSVQNIPQQVLQSRQQSNFSPEDLQHINRIANQMATNMSEDDKNTLRRNVMNLPVQQRQTMAAQNVNPMDIYIRTLATRKFLEGKGLIAPQRGNPGLAPSASGMMVKQARPGSQVSMRPQGQQAPPSSMPQNFDPSFAAGNMDQFLGQQRDALRHQEAGQVVVPASNVQAAPPNARGTPQQNPQAQFGANRQLQNPNAFQQPFWNNTSQAQSQNMSQTSQLQIQSSTPNFATMPGQAPHQQALQGQLGGLNNNRGQRTPQQNHNMPTLNQPLDPPAQAQKETPQKTTQPTPKLGQRNGPNEQQTTVTHSQPNGGQQRPQAALALPPKYANLPPALRQQLSKLPEDKHKSFLMKMQNIQQQRAKAAADAANTSAAPQPNQQVAPAAPMKGSQGVNNRTTPTANPSGAQPPVNPMHRLNMQPQGPQRQDPQTMVRPSQQAPAPIKPIPLSDEQSRYMDQFAFPPNMLNGQSNVAKIPDSVKNWGQLKEWADRNTQNLPPGTPLKLRGLQSIQFQKQFDDKARMMIRNQIMQSQSQVQPQQLGIAPPVPGMLPQSNQPSAQAPTAQMPNTFAMPQLPQPTPQEIQAARALLPAHAKGMNDDQLRTIIMRRRGLDFMKAAQGQQGLAQRQQIQHANMTRAQHSEAGQSQFQAGLTQFQQPQTGQPQHMQNGRQPLQMSRQISQPSGQQTKQHPASRPGIQGNAPQVNQKGVKRNSNDDVIEVPDPKLAQQQPRPPDLKGGQPLPQPHIGLPHLTPQHIASMPPEQRARFEAHRQNLAKQAAHRTANMQSQGQALVGSREQRGAQNTATELRVKQMMSEIAQNMPPRQSLPMSPSTRHQMVEKLGHAGNMVLRMEESLPLFLTRSKSEEATKDLLRTVCSFYVFGKYFLLTRLQRQILLHQVRDQQFVKDKEPNPVDNFTMSLEELNTSSTKLIRYFNFMMRTVVHGEGNAAAPARPDPPQELSTENLQQQQEALTNARAASVQKAHGNNSNRAPAAPTTSHAPFPFGAQSPQRVPHFFSSKNELTQENLKLPMAKKRKGNNQGASATSTPVQVQAQFTPVTKLSPLAKTESPEAQRTPVVPTMMKCSRPDCTTGSIGFATKDDLDKHVLEVHAPKEPVIKDPLDAAAYAIESMRIALDLDKDGKSKPLAQDSKAGKGPLQAPAMKTSASMQGQSSVKQEVTTPMSRIPTQTGPSPSSNLLKTPQPAANVKTPASDAKSMAKDALGAKQSAASAKPPASSPPNPWANSPTRPEWFREVFSGVTSINRPVSDHFITDWFERNPVSPSTSPSSGALDKESPHKSDISTNDNLNINVFGSDGNWLSNDWVDEGLQGDMAALDVGELMDMDWETAFGKPEEDEEEAIGLGRKKKDSMDPSDEWVRNWAP